MTMRETAPGAPEGNQREVIARLIAKWLRYEWDGLMDLSAVDRGFPEWTRGHYQGGKPDLLRLADSILALTATLHAVGELVTWGPPHIEYSASRGQSLVTFWVSREDGEHIRASRATPQDAPSQGVTEALKIAQTHIKGEVLAAGTARYLVARKVLTVINAALQSAPETPQDEQRNSR